MYKKYFNMLINTNVQSDVGLITESINNINLTTNDMFLQDSYISSNNFNDPYLSSVFVTSNNKIIIVKRNYLKLQNVLAIISSLLITIMIIFKLTFKPFIDKIYYEDIVSEIISYNTLRRTPYNLVENLLSNLEVNHKESPIVVKNEALEKVEIIVDTPEMENTLKIGNYSLI